MGEVEVGEVVGVTIGKKKDISHPSKSGHLFDYRDCTTTISSCSKRVNRCISCLYICMLDANGTRALLIGAISAFLHSNLCFSRQVHDGR